MKRILVHIITWNSGNTIKACLDSVLASDIPDNCTLYVTVSDNNSADNTLEVLEEFKDFIRIIKNEDNKGFCAPNNSALAAAAECEVNYFLSLNPDVSLEPSLLNNLYNALESDNWAYAATPKLLRASETDLSPLSPPVLDAAGMYITTTLRHFDRGSEEPDHGQYQNREYVFGGTGACLMLRVSAARYLSLNAVRLEVFDEDFFAYREDADMAWSAANLGFKCLYVPDAVGYHVRKVTPENRSSIAPEINALGVKNRFLLQFKNFSPLINYKCIFPGVFRNLLVVAASLSVEWSSRTALVDALKLFSSQRKKREVLAQRAEKAGIKESELSTACWFSDSPYTEPALLTAEGSSAEEIDLNEYENSIEVIIVNYKSGPRLKKLFDSLYPKDAGGVELAEGENVPEVKVSIVDNNSEDDSLSFLEDGDFSWPASLIVVRNRENIGFAGAVNQIGLNSDAKHILILNPDVEINSSQILELSSELSNYPQLAALGPLLSGSEGIQFGFLARRFPSFISLLIELCGLHQLIPKTCWTRHYKYEDETSFQAYCQNERPDFPSPSLNTPFLVEQPAGACLLTRTDVFKDVGGFDNNFKPAWFEDVDYCKRLKDDGHLLAISNKACVQHEGGYSLKEIGRAKFRQLFYTNLLHYTRKHFNPLAHFGIRLLIPFALFARSEWRLGLEFLKKLVPLEKLRQFSSGLVGSGKKLATLKR